MITKYKLFEKLNSRGSKSLTEEEFNQILKTSCKNWAKSKTSLYRGQVDMGPYVYVDPIETKRKSIDDTNLHVELISNLPCWKNYPKYSSSVIGVSDNKYIADGYGVSYEIIPFDNIDIVFCPAASIWQSFDDGDGGWGDTDTIHLTRSFFELLDINTDVWKSTDGLTIEDKLKAITNIPDQKFIKIFHINEGDHLFLTRASEYLKKNKNEITGEDCYDFINNYLFNPVYRGFKTVKYTAGFDEPSNKQIWTNGPVLLIYRELA